MRIRQIKPEFWRDALLQKELSPVELLVYIGLWMEADDAGWFRVGVQEIGADLFPYRPVDEREVDVASALERLEALKRVEAAACGRHAAIPTFLKHQRLAGPTKRVHTVMEEHEEQCLGGGPAPTRGDPRFPAEARPVRNGQEGIGKGMERVASRQKSLEDVVETIRQRWGWTPSPDQVRMIWEIADHHAEGSAGFARVIEVLAAADGTDPIGILLAADRRLKEAGLASALAQERESSERRQDDGRSLLPNPRGFEAIGGIMRRANDGSIN